MTVPTKQTILRTVSRELPDRSFIVAEVGLRYLEGNRDAYWTATGEIYEAHGTWSGRARFNNEREPDVMGAISEEIMRAWPALASIVSIHGSDTEGVPMHALANGRYFLTNGERDKAARVWRVAESDLPEVDDVDAFVDAQRERWRAESEQAWKALEALR